MQLTYEKECLSYYDDRRAVTTHLPSSLKCKEGAYAAFGVARPGIEER